ncbi:hypothetical protein FH972_021666 [Carpinus fangiana]|uniref:Uncharacterized protein n=1 Tax=Carpinus fangiana TaxID=176857 RepID=A0A5N6KS39_9ROSI|nr:hypothetical protein FH972_021666 [Carpinus fangiana]
MQSASPQADHHQLTSRRDMDAAEGHQRAASHARRQALPRRSTKGPLDAGSDPLTHPHPQGGAPSDVVPKQSPPTAAGAAATSPPPVTVVEREQKDFRFLLRHDIFQPLGHGDLPVPFRQTPETSQDSSPASLLSRGRFRDAANVVAEQLKTNTAPTDHARIFDLYYTRLVCLQLLGLHYQAAQESRALQDFNGAFFRNPSTGLHLAPWELRLLLVRLQAIGFSDWRRGIMTYYELAREARFRARRATAEEIVVWQRRLKDIGIRVGNALIEMGDHDGAARHLQDIAANQALDSASAARLALVYLRIGNVDAAKDALQHVDDNSSLALLDPLCKMADGEYLAAIDAWSAYKDSAEDDKLSPAVAQNMAVCLVYAGRMEEIDHGNFEQSITFNLATVYELSLGKVQHRLQAVDRYLCHQRPRTAKPHLVLPEHKPLLLLGLAEHRKCRPLSPVLHAHLTRARRHMRRVPCFFSACCGVDPGAWAPQIVTGQKTMLDMSKLVGVAVAEHTANGRLAGKVAIVTGGGYGFGAGIVEKFVEEGARVLVVDNKVSRGQEVAKEQPRHMASFCHADVTQSEDWVTILATVNEQFGRLDIVVNNAGAVHKMAVSFPSPPFLVLINTQPSVLRRSSHLVTQRAARLQRRAPPPLHQPLHTRLPRADQPRQHHQRRHPQRLLHRRLAPPPGAGVVCCIQSLRQRRHERPRRRVRGPGHPRQRRPARRRRLGSGAAQLDTGRARHCCRRGEPAAMRRHGVCCRGRGRRWGRH